MLEQALNDVNERMVREASTMSHQEWIQCLNARSHYKSCIIEEQQYLINEFIKMLDENPELDNNKQ